MITCVVWQLYQRRLMIIHNNLNIRRINHRSNSLLKLWLNTFSNYARKETKPRRIYQAIRPKQSSDIYLGTLLTYLRTTFAYPSTPVSMIPPGLFCCVDLWAGLKHSFSTSSEMLHLCSRATPCGQVIRPVIPSAYYGSPIFLLYPTLITSTLNSGRGRSRH
jgi:hypothetical protein